MLVMQAYLTRGPEQNFVTGQARPQSWPCWGGWGGK